MEVKNDEVVERLLTHRAKVTHGELRELVKAVQAHGGEVVQVSAFGGADPDDWCGTMWFKKPRPKVGPLIDVLLDRGWVVEVFPYGIPVLDQVRLDVRNQAGARRG